MTTKQLSILVVVLTTVTAGAVTLFVIIRKPTQIPAPSASTTTSGNDRQTTINLPPIREGFQRYVDYDFGYGFSYPATETLDKCHDIPCLSIKSFTLKVEPLRQEKLSSNTQSGLLNVDLFCEADGPRGSVSCKNIKMDEYGNSFGVRGYKVFRTKTFTGIDPGFPVGEYQDIAYILLLPEVKKVGGRDYAGILFAVDNPSPSNQASLSVIVDSFFSFAPTNK